MAVNKDAIGILFGVAGGGAVNSESYNEINKGLDNIVKGINANDPKYIKLHIDDAEFDKEIDRVKDRVKEIAIGSKVKIASGEAAASLKQVEQATKAATAAVKEEEKATAAATAKVNKKKEAYEASTRALEEYQRLVEKAAKGKGAKSIRVDENGVAYTDSQKLSDLVARMNTARQQMIDAVSDKATGGMYKRDVATLLKKEQALSQELAVLMKNFRTTTAEKEAARAAEIEATTQRQKEQMAAATAALDAMSRYRDVLREVAEAGTVTFNGKDIIPKDATEAAISDAERLKSAFAEAYDALHNPNVTEAGKKGVLESFNEEIQSLIQQLNPVIQKEAEETQTLDTETEHRKAANAALLETLQLMRELAQSKSQLDQLSVNGNGMFEIIEAGGGRFIKNTAKMSLHQEQLLDVVNRTNEALVRFKEAMQQSGVDSAKFASSQQYIEMQSLIRQITSEIEGASAEAREMYDILYNQDYGGTTNGTHHAKQGGLVGLYASQIRGAKGDKTALASVFEGIKAQAESIAATSGEAWADEFFRAVERTAHKKIPYWKQTVAEMSPAVTGQNTDGAPTAAQRLDSMAGAVAELEAQIPALLEMAKEQGGEAAEAAQAVVEQIAQAKAETDALVKSSSDVVNNEREEAQAAEQTVRAERKKNDEKKKGQRSAEEAVKAAKQEAENTKAAVAVEQQKAKAKKSSKQASEAVAKAAEQEAKSAQIAAEAEKQKKDTQTNANRSGRSQPDEELKGLSDTQKLRLQWIEAERQHRAEMRAEERARREEERAAIRVAAEEEKAAIKAVAEEERQWRAEQKAAQQEVAANEAATRRRMAEEEQRAVDLRLEELQLQQKIAAFRARDDHSSTTYGATYAALQNVQAELSALREISPEALKYAESTDKVRQAVDALRQAEQQRNYNATTQWARLQKKALQELERYRHAESNADYKTVADQIREVIRTGAPDDFNRLNDLLAKSTEIISKNKLETASWGQNFIKTFGTRLRSMAAGALIGKLMQALRGIYSTVLDINTAMTQLRIVTQANEREIEKFSRSVESAAQRIGASIADLVKSTTTYARLGFSLEDAEKFAELTTAYSKVADVSVDDATTNITAIIKAYDVGADQLENVIDKLIYVGRKYAISSGEIGEGMNNAASALVANGNSLDQALGILTAANVTAQNISRSSTGTRTIAARLSASKALLDELGEDGQGVETVAKLSESMRAFGINIQKGNGELYSTYEILGQIAERWEYLDDESRNAIANLAAGTRQQDIFYSIIQNWSDARSIVADVSQSSGELASATEERLDSIQGKLDQFKASFETLSQNILSSGLVKGLVDLLNTVVKFLNLGNGFQAKMLAGAAAVALLAQAITTLKGVITSKSMFGPLITGLSTYIKFVKQATVATGAETAMIDENTAATIRNYTTGLGGIISFIPRTIAAIALYIKSLIASKTATDGATASTLTFEAALEALNVNPLMLAFTALAAVGFALVKGAQQYTKSRREANELLDEESQKARDISETRREEAKTIAELIDQYEAIAAAGAIDASHRQEIREIQRDINRLTQGQADNLDLINGKLDDELQKLAQLRVGVLGQNIRTYQDELAVARSTANDIVKGRSAGAGRRWESGRWDKYLGSDISIDEFDVQAANILGELEGIHVLNDYGSAAVPWDKNKLQLWLQGSGAEELLARIQQAMDALFNDSSYDIDNSKLYRALATLKQEYLPYVEAIEEAETGLIDGMVQYLGVQMQVDGQTVNSADSFNVFRQLLLNSSVASRELSKELSTGAITQKEIAESVDEFMALNFPQYYDEWKTASNGVFVSLKSISDLLAESQEGYDGLVKVLKNVTTEGYLTAESLTTVLNLVDKGALAGMQLSDVLIKDANGYRLVDGVLQTFINSLIDANTVTSAFNNTTSKENAIANLEELYRVISTLMLVQEASANSTTKQTDALNDQKDALQEQLDAYKELIDLRKELLQQYQDEITYKKELEKRERKVASLQTQVAVSQLDNTAAGRARTRQLMSDLAEAQEDLDDFTLEHAIDVVTKELDEQYDEYKRWIDGKIKEIEDAIDALKGSVDDSAVIDNEELANLAAKIQEAIEKVKLTAVVNVQTDGEPGGITTKGRPRNAYTATVVEVKHSGGIVGNVTTLKSTEEFAKLLKGEFVATPRMMERFMHQTLPGIASSGENVEFNAPLINIQCDTVTQDSLPKLQDVIDSAVKEIKRQFDNGLSRAGYRKTVNQIV